MSLLARAIVWTYVVVALLVLVGGGWLAFNRATSELPTPQVDCPGPWPTHGPACIEMQWLDGRWVCVPEEEAG